MTPLERRPDSWRRNMADEGEEHEKSLQEEKAQEQSVEFLERFRGTISGYFGNEAVHFTCKPGGWYIDMNTGRVNMDPNFFLERGYGESEALFAMFHEAEHFRDAARNPEAYREVFSATENLGKKVHPAYNEKLNQFFNCLDDVMVNQTVMGRWKAGDKAKDSLYPKLFSSNDFRQQPRYRQFMYTFLRESMLPDEPCLIDEEVRQTIDAYNNRTKEKTGKNTVDVVNGFDPAKQAPHLSAKERFDHFFAVLEPIFRNYFLQDVKDWEENKEKGEGEGAPDPFGEDPLQDANLDPISAEDIVDQIEEYKNQKENKKDQEFKENLGVERRDFEAYQRDYQVIAPYLQEMREVFDRLIDERISYSATLTKPSKEGPRLDQNKLAIGAAEIKAGNLEPKIFLDYELKSEIDRQPSEIEFHVIADGTGSVSSDQMKIAAQRRAVILFLEAIYEFRKKIEQKKQQGITIPLTLKTEVRQFADKDRIAQPLTETLNHKQRIAIHKELTNNLLGGGNDETHTFNELLADLTPEKQQKLRKGDLKIITIVLTDGGTEVNMQSYMRQLQEKAGSKTGYAIGAIGYGSDGKAVEQVYHPVGKYAPNVNQLPKAFEDMLIEMLGNK